MASAENEPQGHAATLRPSWSTSRGPTRTQGDAEVDHDAALAQLLAFKGSEGRDGTDQSSVALPSASQQAAEPSVDGTGGGGSAITAWQGVLQAQGLIALGVSSPQTPAAGFGASDSAQCSGMDTATLIQLARDAQAAGVPASRVPPSTLNDPSQPPTWNAITPQGGQTSGAADISAMQMITAVTQETHFAPGPASQVAQALPAGQDADQAPDATSVRQNTRASANPGSAAAVPATTVAQTQSMQPALRSLDRAASASPPDDGAGAMPPESPHPHGGSPGTVRAIDPATGKAAHPTVQQFSAEPRSPSLSAGDHVDGLERGNAAPVNEHAASASSGEAPHSSGAIPTPAHQVAAQIVSATDAIKSELAAPPGTLAGMPAAGASVVKVLRIELQPADLGTITIRMSLKDDGLDVRVEAGRYDTARMLQQDQDSLARLLTGAGYRIDGMTVVSTPTHASASPDGASQAFQSSSTQTQQGGGASQSDPRSSGGRQEPQSDPRAPRNNQDDDHDKSRSARGPGGDLYV
jgi:chemotaxis protein MotD